MRQYSLDTLPTYFEAQELSDDDVCLRKPRTIEELLDILHLLTGMIQEAERRSAYRGESCDTRNECVLHLREFVLHLQRGGGSPYAKVSRLTLPEWKRPA